MSKCTPGPWEVSDDSNYILGNTNGDDMGEVADVSNTINQEANAKLIAASPDLLTELKRVIAIAEDLIQSEYKGTSQFEALVDDLGPARRLITKVEGANA